MKALYFKSSLLLACILIAGISLEAQTLKKDFHKEMNTNSSTELKIHNQFGNVTVTDWDQNKIVIDVIVEVKGSTESKSQKLLDKINVEFSEEGNTLTAKTKIGDDGKLNINNSKNEEQSFNINYTVKCPKNIQLNINNQFGDVMLSPLTGPVKIDLQFGSLNASSLASQETKIDIQFGSLTIGTLKDANIEAQHCQLIKITECGNLSFEAQFSKVEIGTVDSFKAELNHSEVNVENLTDNLKLEGNFGSTKINNVSADFKSIRVEQNMGDVTISIDPKAGYHLTAEASMGSVKVPAGLKDLKEKEHSGYGPESNKISGTYGDGRSTIEVNCNMGTVRIK